MARFTFKEIRAFKHRINPEERQGSYGLYFMRRLSVFFTWLLLNLGLSANQVTVLQIISGLAGAVSFAFPHIQWQLLGVFFLQLGFLFDNVDGEIARIRKQASITGKFLDTVGHEFVVTAMYFGLATGSYFRTGHFEVLVFGFLAGLFSLRLDILTLYVEVGQMLETHKQQAFDYYSNLQKEAQKDEDELNLYRQKNEASVTRIIYALFAYPGIMNIFSVAIFSQIFVPHFTLSGYTLEPVYVLLVMYGAIMPVRRTYTIRKLVKNRETERKYMQLQRAQISKEKAKERPVDKKGVGR